MNTLHVLNGGETDKRLERSGLPGERVVWADVLHEGPVPCAIATDFSRRVRAEYLASAGYGLRDVIGAQLEAADEMLARWFDFDEVVFWLERDLFDQLLLARHLAWLSHSNQARERARLVVADRHLGSLSAPDLAALYPGRRPVTADEVAAGQEAWRAVCADDPSALVRLAAGTSPVPVPHLGSALKRLLEEYPAVGSGLSRSERQLLAAASQGHDTLVDCFRAASSMEESAFMGDLSFARIARGLAGAAEPLITLTPLSGDEGPLHAIVAPTAFGRAVAAGEADHVRTNGIDSWIGGVHLSGHGPLWRVDGTRIVWA
jgi:hypothetical protein